MVDSSAHELLRAIQDDDQDAVSDFDCRIRPRLISFGRRRGLSLEEAEDAAQDTLMAAYSQLKSGKFRAEGSLEAWIGSIFSRRANDVLRGRYRGRQAFIAIADVEDMPGPSRQEDQLEVREALLAMSIHDRLALLLNLQWGLTAREMAPILQLGEKSMEAVLTRAKKQFRALLRENKENLPSKRLNKGIAS